MVKAMQATLRLLDKIIDGVGWLCVGALLLMIVNVFIDVFVRYVLIDTIKYFGVYGWYDAYFGWLGGIAMQELEWHWFSIVFLLGLGYTLRTDGHVRVDVFYDRFSAKTKAYINIIGSLIFALPFSLLVLSFTWEFFYESFSNEENRGDPGSLPRLWPVKFILPVAFFFLILSVVAVVVRELLNLQLADHKEVRQ